MRVFQALRRSIKGEKDAKPHMSIAPKSALAIVPPKKVCVAAHESGSQEPSRSRLVPTLCCRGWRGPYAPTLAGLSLKFSVSSRLFEPSTTTKHAPARNSVFPAVTFFTSLAEKTTPIGTKLAIPLCPTPAVSFLSHTSKPWVAPSATAPTRNPADHPLANPTIPITTLDTARRPRQPVFPRPLCP